MIMAVAYVLSVSWVADNPAHGQMEMGLPASVYRRACLAAEMDVREIPRACARVLPAAPNKTGTLIQHWPAN